MAAAPGSVLLAHFQDCICEEVATESFFGTCGGLEQIEIYPCKSLKTTDFNC